MSKEISLDTLRNTILLGNATFTLLSDKTERYFTYKVKRSRKYVGCFNVYTLAGPRYVYLFTMVFSPSTQYTLFRTTKPTVMRRFGYAYTQHNIELKHKTFTWLHRLLCEYLPQPNKLHVFKSDRCWCCGKVLTTPESIERGVGPECFSKMSKR